MRAFGLLVALAASAVLAGPAAAAERMFVGFQDDPSFRWRDDRAAVLDRAVEANAGLVRTTVYWWRIAPSRPANAANPFDPAYRWDDLDELVRAAQYRGMESMLTIWGTPDWANRGRGPNRPPARMSDLQAFAQALAARYSGRHPGLPHVRFYSVWNEPNLEQFLAPTFDAKGRPVSPFTYARMFRAAYAGLKAGNRRALVAVGETSPRGRDRPSPGPVQDSIAPATFARLLSTVRPVLRFDAWAHHPYSTLGSGPLQRARFPNVQLTNLPQLEDSLRRWFRRKTVPIWITEYGFETRPGEPKGVTPAQQAVYARQSLQLVRDLPYVDVFVWFILRDDPTSTWQSGLLNRNGSRKPAFAAFAAAAKAVDARSPIVRVRRNQVPVVRIPVLELAARDGVGEVIGATIRLFNHGQLASVAQLQTKIDVDGWATFIFGRSAVQATYLVTFDINDKNGNTLQRTATLIIT